jgi:hypothetical protein
MWKTFYQGGYIIVRNPDRLRAALGSDEGMLLDLDHQPERFRVEG